MATTTALDPDICPGHDAAPIVFPLSHLDWNLFGASLAILTPAYYLTRKKGQSLRVKSWILSFYTSFATLTASLFLGNHKVWLGQFNAQLYQSETLFTKLTVIFFITFLLLDMLIGAVEYPSQQSLLTCWVHHIFYVILLYRIVRRHLTAAFACLFIEELPTLLLAIGNLNKKYSWPFGFGFSFFMTRIVFHAWFTIQIWIHNYKRDDCHVFPYFFINCLILMVNIKWFADWYYSSSSGGVLGRPDSPQ